MRKEELLKEVEKELEKKELPLKKEATNLVFGKGDAESEVLIIGEAPGKNEDLQGKPFVGMAGKELDLLLKGQGVDPENVYIANILKYRPPLNRNPNKEEIEAHTPYLIKQINIIKPKVIVTLGNYATKFVLAKFDVKEMNKIKGITSLNGKKQVINVNEETYKVIPCYHPAAILYNRTLKPEVEKTVKKVSEELKLFF